MNDCLSVTECPTLTETPGPLQVVARDAVAVVAAIRVDTQLMTRVSAVEAFVKICTQSPTHTNDDFKIQVYYFIREIKYVAKNIPHIAYFKTQRTVAENTGDKKRYILNKLVIYAVLSQR